MEAYLRYREDVSRIRTHDVEWTRWQSAMVPRKNLGEGYTNRVGNQQGSIDVNIHEAFTENIRNSCGIYEWKLVEDEKKDEKKDGKKEIVVYVGSTCTKERSPLMTRIRQYCTDGSHKKDLINDALERGYELHVRVKRFSNVAESREAENQYLVLYNYAWNIQRNGVRNPFRGL